MLHYKMNQFTLLVVILVVFTYYGGSNVPKVLKDNKELLLGVVGGLVWCSFFSMRLEGIDPLAPAPATPAPAERVHRRTPSRHESVETHYSADPLKRAVSGGGH